MRIPTYIHFRNQANSLSEGQNQIDTISLKLQQRKKILASSEDPVLAQQITRVKDYQHLIKTYDSNIVLGKARNALYESSFNGSINELKRANELIKMAQNGTTNDTDRNKIAVEMKGILNSLLNFANTRDANGEYIFSGTNVKVEPFSLNNDQYQYHGSQETTSIPLSIHERMLYNDVGSNIFSNMKTGNGSFSISQGSMKNTGTAVTSVGHVSNSSVYVEDSYTLKFVTNGNGNLSYQIIGKNSGQVIPAPPKVIPQDAPEYKDGMDVNFNGITFSIKGQPNIGDEFVVSPSVKQNVFDTINQTVKKLNQANSTESDKAEMLQCLNQLSEQINLASNQLTNCLSDIGFRTKQLELIESKNKVDIANQKSIRQSLEDADPFEFTVMLKESMSNLEITQSIYTKIQNFFFELMRNKL